MSSEKAMPHRALPEDVTLLAAKNWLRERVDDGEHCPCCGQLAKVYRRQLNAAMARALIMFWRAGATTDWVHGPTLLRGARADEGKLRYWGLLDEQYAKRDDGGRAGWWRVTTAGARFVAGTSRVPKYALVYDGRCLGLGGEFITIHDALATRFNYDQLMTGAA